MLWKRELQNASVKHEDIEEEHGSRSQSGIWQDMKGSSKAQAYFKQALSHFETLRQLEIPETDNVNAFTILHYEVGLSTYLCSHKIWHRVKKKLVFVTSLSNC